MNVISLSLIPSNLHKNDSNIPITKLFFYITLRGRSNIWKQYVYYVITPRWKWKSITIKPYRNIKTSHSRKFKPPRHRNDVFRRGRHYTLSTLCWSLKTQWPYISSNPPTSNLQAQLISLRQPMFAWIAIGTPIMNRQYVIYPNYVQIAPCNNR